LGILDALKDIKIISDASSSKAVTILIPKIKEFKKKDIESVLS
jgi:hypothetical protein